jgi:hypothetical protein
MVGPVADTAVEVAVVVLVVSAVLYQPPDPVHQMSVERVADSDAGGDASADTSTVDGPVREFDTLPERQQAGIEEALVDEYGHGYARVDETNWVEYGVRYDGALYQVRSHPSHWNVADYYYDPTPWGIYALVFAGGLLATRSVVRHRGWY